MNDAEFIRLVSERKVFAVVRAESAALALRAAEAAIIGGIKLVEVALVMAGGFRVISDLRRQFGDRACIGAGSVMSYEQIDRAIQDVQDTLEGGGDELQQHAAPPPSVLRTERLRRALEQLARAQDDLEQRQQDSFWKGYKAKSAQEHIEVAKRAIRRAMGQ